MTCLHVVHSTNYSYGKPVTVSYNEARVTPQTDAAQVVLETDLRIAPMPRRCLTTAITGVRRSIPSISTPAMRRSP